LDKDFVRINKYELHSNQDSVDKVYAFADNEKIIKVKFDKMSDFFVN
jgi:hypothetical protein